MVTIVCPQRNNRRSASTAGSIRCSNSFLPVSHVRAPWPLYRYLGQRGSIWRWFISGTYMGRYIFQNHFFSFPNQDKATVIGIRNQFTHKHKCLATVLWKWWSKIIELPLCKPYIVACAQQRLGPDKTDCREWKLTTVDLKKRTHGIHPQTQNWAACYLYL